MQPTRLCCPWDSLVAIAFSSCFHIVVNINSATMNTGVHVSFQIMVFSEYMPSSLIAGSHVNYTSKTNKHTAKEKKINI